MEKNSIILTKEQKIIVENLKKHLKVVKKRTEPFISDYFVFRFLEARNWKETKTRTMLENYFIFRDRMMKKAEELKERRGYNN
jgi:hypothetical protein